MILIGIVCLHETVVLSMLNWATCLVVTLPAWRSSIETTEMHSVSPLPSEWSSEATCECPAAPSGMVRGELCRPVACPRVAPHAHYTFTPSLRLHHLPPIPCCSSRSPSMFTASTRCICSSDYWHILTSLLLPPLLCNSSTSVPSSPHFDPPGTVVAQTVAPHAYLVFICL